MEMIKWIATCYCWGKTWITQGAKSLITQEVMGSRAKLEKHPSWRKRHTSSIVDEGEFGCTCTKLAGFVVRKWVNSFPVTSIFSMKYESGSLGGGGCVGGLRKREMMWYSHLAQMKKCNKDSRAVLSACFSFLDSELVNLALWFFSPTKLFLVF